MTGVKSRERARLPGFMFAVFFVLCILLTTAVRGDAMDIGKTLPGVLREAPSVDMYGGENGFVLLRDMQYRLRADGSMEKSVYLVVEEVSGLSKAWPAVGLTAPPGGSCEVLEAALYNPRTAMPVISIQPRKMKAKNGDSLEIRIPNNLEGRILVIGYKEVHPSTMNIEDRVELALDIPAWEQKVSVEVPGGMDLVYSGGGDEPRLESDGPTDTYTWTFIDVPPGETTGIFDEPSRTLVFSLREGDRRAIEAAGAEEPASATIPLPEEIRRILAGGPSLRTGEAILGRLAGDGAAPGLLDGDYVRSAGDIPPEGPWTLWEATFLAKDWMEKAGWDAEILWDPAIRFSKPVPGTRKLWREPVLFLTPPSGKEFYYRIGQEVPPGTMPPSLWGKTLYTRSGSGITKQTVPTGDAGDHRLMFRWILELDEKGNASGEIRVRARGGWLEALTGGRVPTEENLPELLAGIGFPNTPDISWKGASLRAVSTGFDVTVPFSTPIGILSGGDILVRWPVAVFPWQNRALSQDTRGMSLRHPLVFEQQAQIKLPDGFDVVALPSLRPSQSTGITLTEEMKYTKRRQNIEGGYKVVVTSSGLGEDGFGSFQSVTGRNLGWANMTIPLRKIQ